MRINIPSPKHYESYYGSSELVRTYLDRIEITVGALITSEVIETLNISLLIASDEELAQGKFLAYESFDWRCGYASVGVNGNFARYHLGDDLDKIFELSEMLKAAFDRVGKNARLSLTQTMRRQLLLKLPMPSWEMLRQSA